MQQELKRGIRISEPNIALANIYTLIAALATVFFIAFFYFVIDNLFLSGVMVLVLIGVFVNYIILRRTKNNEIAAYTLLAMGAAIMFCLFAGGWENMGLIWPFAWLPATFWMNKGKGGRVFMLVFFAGALIISLLHVLGIISLPYSTYTLVNFFSALVVFAALMILYQNATIDYETFLVYKQHLFETSIDPMIIVDVNCKISDLNLVTETITGISRKHLIQSDLSSYFTAPEAFREVCSLAASEGAVHNSSLSIRHAGGSLITDLLVNATVYRDDKTKSEKLFIVMRDVTQIKEAERKKAELANELENANKDLEAFTYSVAHDLRTPLRSIHGFTKLLENEYGGKLDEEGRRLMKVITGSSTKMGQLIDDLLEFSRLGKKELQKENIDTAEMIHSIVGELINAEFGNKPKIIVNNLLPIYGDDGMLRQAFLNLISNALKYSRTQTNPIIEIGSYTDGNENIYYVKDNGVGFDMQYYGKLFNIFQRLHSTKHFEGTGIGLAIVKQVISRHGGRVWAEGKLNEGAVFYFTIHQTNTG